jgi:hypothetical protein
MGRSTRTRAAHDGSAFQFSSLTAFGDALGTGIAVDYLATRGARPGTQGWQTHAITPPQEPLSANDLIIAALDPRYVGEFSDDFTRGIFLSKAPLADAPNVANVSLLYRRNDLRTPGVGSYDLVTDCPACAAPLPPFAARQPGLAGGSSDLSHVIFESFWNLTSEAVDAGLDEGLPKLYEWDSGTLRLAGILPDGSPAPSSAAGRGAGAGNAAKLYTPDTISADGSRIAFTAPVDVDSRDSAGVADLYLREDHNRTIQINAEERTLPPDPPQENVATFWTASADLSRIFFSTQEQLTDDDTSETSRDLYMYDASRPAIDPHNLTLIGDDSEPDDGTGSDVLGAIGSSAAGDYVYFYSTNQLVDDGVAGSTVVPCSPDVCIFVWHDGVTRFVGRTAFGEESQAILGGNWLIFETKGARITEDGKRLAFLSDGTSDDEYDHGTSCGGGFDEDRTYFTPNPGCAELYVYDATADGGEGELTCVSCNPSGVHTTDTETRIDLKTATLSLGTDYLNHPVSDDGRFVFFSTGEPLLPEDVNGDVYDAYQYDMVTRELSLLSSGDTPNHAFFLDASADGRDVFFRTREQLVGWDTDQQIDVYDARVGGGFPEPVIPVACQGAACQGPQGPGLNLPAPGTATFESDEGTDQGRRVAVFHTFALGSKKLRRWAKTGVVTLLVRVSDGGRVSTRVRGRVGGRSRLLAQSAKRVSDGGTVALQLRLSRAARAALNAKGRLAVSIHVAYSRSNGRQHARATLLAP